MFHPVFGPDGLLGDRGRLRHRSRAEGPGGTLQGMRRSLRRSPIANGKTRLDVSDNGLLLIGELAQQRLVALPVAASPLQAGTHIDPRDGEPALACYAACPWREGPVQSRRVAVMFGATNPSQQDA